MSSKSLNRSIPGLTQDLNENFVQGNNYLFAIGINNYQNFQPLVNARKDIEDLAGILEKEYNFEKENIRVLYDAEATKANIIDELENLRAKIRDKDSLLIYYSGHGWQQKETERGFWIPVDAEKERISSFISNAELKDIIASIQAQHILLISDSCFSASLLTRDVSGVIGSAFEDWMRYPSRWAFVSGKGPVSDGESGENSPFAESIISQLKNNESDAINIMRLAVEVIQLVRFRNKQMAELSPLDVSGHEGGQFVFIKKQSSMEDSGPSFDGHKLRSSKDYPNKYSDRKHEMELKPNLIDPADEEEWNKVMRVVSQIQHPLFAYRKYKEKYPSGIHIKEVENKIKAFEEEERKQQLKQGKIVHNVPPKMQAGIVTTCIVKIAGKEEYFLQDPDYKVHEYSTPDLLDISDNMKVEIKGDENIKVEAISDAEQLVDDHSPTTWLFRVTPLTLGKHNLTLLAYTLYDNGKKKNTKYYNKFIEVVAEPQPDNNEFYEYPLERGPMANNTIKSAEHIGEISAMNPDQSIGQTEKEVFNIPHIDRADFDTIDVSGTVSDLSGKPLSKIQVTNITNKDIPIVYSDINGKYDMPGLKEGDELCFKNESASMTNRVLKVGKSKILNATLDKLELADIQGNVTDTRGTPLDNVTITIRFSHPKRTATSDAEGHYTLPNVGTGEILDINYKGHRDTFSRYLGGQEIFNIKLDHLK